MSRLTTRLRSWGQSLVSSVNGSVGDVLITKSSLGLGNVDNTSDANKPVSTATQAALNGITKSSLGLGNVDNTSDANKPVSTATQAALNGITKSSLGLGNVDNTSDANKPVSTATQAALNGKADLVGGKVSSTQLPDIVDDFVTGGGDKLASAETVKVLSSALNQETLDRINTDDVILNTLGGLIGHPGDTTNPHAVTKSQVGLGNVDNTSDANKPVSTATQAALNTVYGKVVFTHSYTLTEARLLFTFVGTTTAGRNNSHIYEVQSFGRQNGTENTALNGNIRFYVDWGHSTDPTLHIISSHAHSNLFYIERVGTGRSGVVYKLGLTIDRSAGASKLAKYRVIEHKSHSVDLPALVTAEVENDTTALNGTRQGLPATPLFTLGSPNPSPNVSESTLQSDDWTLAGVVQTTGNDLSDFDQVINVGQADARYLRLNGWNLTEYAGDSAAGTAGLVAGDPYHTGGVVKIKL